MIRIIGNNRTQKGIRYLVILFLILFGVQNVRAQKATIKSLELKGDDKSAVEFERKDINQQPCALLKVKFDQQGTIFEGNVIGNVEQKDGIYWVYITQGTYNLHIKQESIVPLDLNFRDFNIRGAVPGATYLLTLEMQTAPMKQDTRQYLALIVEPRDSKVTIDGKPQEVKPNGTVVAYVGKGKHTYEVTANSYTPKKGEVEIGNEAVVEKVRLVNDRVHVFIDCLTPGSQVYIDGVLKGDAPWEGELKPGNYTLEARATKCKPSLIKKTFAPMTNPRVMIPPPPVISERPQDVTCQTFTVNGVSFNMIDVKGGTFRFADAYDVQLTDYAIGETEVTQELWEAVMGNNPSNSKGKDLPVDRVSLKDSEEFIVKLNKLTGKQFHIPTSAQWEYAAKGGIKSHGYKYSGSNDLRDVALSREGSMTRLRSSYPVKSRFPNELGIYGMTGNIHELCLWHPSDLSKLKDRQSPLVNPGENAWTYPKSFLQRGGYYADDAESLLLSRIGHTTSDTARDVYRGLRLVLY